MPTCPGDHRCGESTERPGKRFDQALTDHLATFNEQDIPDSTSGSTGCMPCCTGGMWAAAYLTGGACSDDAFIDFRAGIIAQGHGWHEKVAAFLG